MEAKLDNTEHILLVAPTLKLALAQSGQLVLDGQDMVVEMVAMVEVEAMLLEEQVVRPVVVVHPVGITIQEEAVQQGLLVESEKSEYLAGKSCHY